MINTEKAKQDEGAKALEFTGFWIEHNCKKTKRGYIVDAGVVAFLNKGLLPRHPF